MEYVTDALFDQLSGEIVTQAMDYLRRCAVEQAQAKDYVREIQVRLLVRPLVEQLRAALGSDSRIEEQCLSLLTFMHTEDDNCQGYSPANVISLLKELRGNLRGLDLSRLAICGAYLQGVEMQDASLARATLRDIVFIASKDVIRAVAISLDGHFWVTGSGRGKTQVWREGGKTLHLAWQAHTDTIRTLAFNLDGATLATGSWDGAIKLWELERGALLWTNWLPSKIQRIGFAPDGRTLASGSVDRTVKLWEVGSGRCLQTLTGHTNAVFAIAWSADGRLLASSDRDHLIWLWDVERGRYRAALSGHEAGVYGIAFTPESGHLLSGSDDGSACLWDASCGMVQLRLVGHHGMVRSVAWSSDGRQVASPLALATRGKVTRGKSLCGMPTVVSARMLWWEIWGWCLR